ncbi:hypothetical protein ABVB18_20875 [Xanthomonas citri pv. mangiferaeindicae]|uniref:Uncharacterized protein n=1 Tax=Xanthomonas hortorum pv. hederae TaxID=453603 RepID=A0A9X4BWD7_9XANT|nr:MULTISPECIES: hypothetical protein [Xanthomonas]MDC8640805.1 hypothetical protein [Xanthomonas hortorum pv. hederae]MDM7706242.1 hypothetical protein [Xanthomonas campestris pv. campestris]MDM7880947.1 hypothetical protein [Xanthomonas campestris pv. campestris]MDO0860860.1 hypothetical protein [Xanthomonas campestris pv. campestris]MEB1935931.1 hypothetical protein [Xanthomonas campestris pv. campestris]
MAELKIKQVWNDKGETFFPEDIDDKVKRDQMGPELFDVEFNPVCAHPRKGDHRSHFKLKSGSQRSPSNPDQIDETHNDAIDILANQLNRTSPPPPARPLAPIKISAKTGIWKNKTELTKNVWASNPSSIYRFYKDPATRLMLSGTHSIQPDIIGIDTTRINRTKINPTIIIEVVNTHWPDQNTWEQLVALSRINYIIGFYFVSKEVPKSNNWNNSANVYGINREIVLNSYLHEGLFHHKNEPESPNTGNLSHYQTIKDKAMRSAEDLFAKQIEKAKENKAKTKK